jgi:endonuclease/exonuclease/phosphatase (EEP) superfamily protein YafD
MSRPRSVPGLWTGVAAGVVGGAVLLADLLALDRTYPFVGTTAWRPQASVVAAAAAFAMATRRELRPAAVSLGTVSAVGMTLAARRMPGPAATSTTGEAVSILTFNALRGRADAGRLADVVRHERPDLVVLTEAGCGFRDRLMPCVDGLGYRAWGSTGTGVRESRGVVLLASPRAGGLRVRVGYDMHYRHLHATGGLLGSRRLFAVHATAPRDRARAADWRRDLAVVSRWCHADPAPIIVGDLNATLDHSALRAALGGCRSAAAGRRRGRQGTYPAGLPRGFGIQIDHVLVPAATLTTRFEVLDLLGSDHRAVLVGLQLPEVDQDSERRASSRSGQRRAPHLHDGKATRADTSGSTR